MAIVDGYIENATEKSAIGVYLFSRSLLELAAFSHDVSSRLRVIANEPEEKWKPKGEQQFFGIIMRARFGTSNPDIAKRLKESGASKKHLEPFNVMQSLSKLMTNQNGSVLKGKYNSLCDYVHHNLSSHYTSSPGFRAGSWAHSSGGDGMIMMKDSLITRYKHPIPSKAEKAINETIEVVTTSLEICIESLNEMPRTPYSESQLESITGSNFGVTCLPAGMVCSYEPVCCGPTNRYKGRLTLRPFFCRKMAAELRR